MHSTKIMTRGTHLTIQCLLVFLCFNCINCSSIFLDKLRYKRDVSDSFIESNRNFNSEFNEGVNSMIFPARVTDHYRISRHANVQNNIPDYTNCIYDPFTNSWVYFPPVQFNNMLNQGNPLAAFNNAFLNNNINNKNVFNNQNGFGFFPAIMTFPNPSFIQQNPWFLNRPNYNVNNDCDNEDVSGNPPQIPKEVPQNPEQIPQFPIEIPQNPEDFPQTPEKIPQTPQQPEAIPEVPDKIPQTPEAVQLEVEAELPNVEPLPSTDKSISDNNIIPTSTEAASPEVTTEEEFSIDVRFQGAASKSDTVTPTAGITSESKISNQETTTPSDDSSIAL